MLIDHSFEFKWNFVAKFNRQLLDFIREYSHVSKNTGLCGHSHNHIWTYDRFNIRNRTEQKKLYFIKQPTFDWISVSLLKCHVTHQMIVWRSVHWFSIYVCVCTTRCKRFVKILTFSADCVFFCVFAVYRSFFLSSGCVKHIVYLFFIAIGLLAVDILREG